MKQTKKTGLLTIVVLGLVVSVTAVAQGESIKAHHAEKKFNRIDTNGDGAISLDEQMAFVEARFHKADKDSDGQLTLEEIKMSKLKHKMKKLNEQAE